MKDYAKKNFKQAKAQKANAPSSAKTFDKKRFWTVWGSALFVIILALVAAQLFYRHYQSTQQIATKKSKAVVVSNTITQPKQIASKPKFDFYEVLPKQTVTAPQNNNTAAQIQPKKYQYMLQVASYRGKSQAKAMQARLLLLGLTPMIKSTSSGWYRVDLGPYLSRRKAAVIMHKIQKASISGSMIRAIPKS